MNQTKERFQKMFVCIIDIACSIISYYLAGYIWLIMIKKYSWATANEYMYNSINTMMIAVLISVLLFFGVRDFVRRGIYEEFKSVFSRCALTGGMIAIYELIHKSDERMPRGVFVLSIGIAFVLILICRFILKGIFRHIYKSERTSRIILVTSKNRLEGTVNRILESSDWLRKLVSIIVVDEDMIGQKVRDIPIVARRDNMIDYLKSEIVDEVFLNIDYVSRDMLRPLVMQLEDMGITVHIKIDLLEEFQDFDEKLGRIGKEPVVSIAINFHDIKSLFVKRVFDIFVGIIGSIITIVLYIIVGPIIKLESKGPVLFKQQRVGKNGRFFYIYKFRSMCNDAEAKKKELLDQNEMGGLMFKMEEDPRITKVGKFIRKTSIDEFPQFFNILKGDMSLVGTRPPTKDEFEQYEGHHKRRLSMKPGLTGMWQAYGRNTVSDFEDIVKMDLEYIDKWSIALDIKIMLKTVQVVFKGK